jgi:hypothetical protein
MRNLRNIRYEPWTPPAQFNGRPVTGATWDLTNESIVCTFGPSEDNSVIELVRVKTIPKSQYFTHSHLIGILLIYIQRKYTDHFLGRTLSQSGPCLRQDSKRSLFWRQLDNMSRTCWRRHSRRQGRAHAGRRQN